MMPGEFQQPGVASMASFDVVSEVDLHQLTNAVDQAGRVIANRFDFKGVDASFQREERTVLMTADAEFQLDQMQDMLRSFHIIEKLGLKRLSVYFTGQNLMTFTSYKSGDPEVNTDIKDYLADNPSVIIGENFFTPPQAKTYLFGLKAAF